MDWVYLGHAMWLVRVGELRLLFDPLLDGRHHGGVFDVHPQRTLNVEALQPDFIIVSHRHPDHFHVESLRRLAELDADSVLVTSDELVEMTAKELGFHRVARVDAWQRLELDGDVAMVTTPSAAEDIEWGIMLASPQGVAWNQVDTVFRDRTELTQTIERALAALVADAKPQLDLALVRWQPMLEVQALLGEATAFPFDDYAIVLQQIAELNAKTIVPAAAGTRHIGTSAWLNDFVFPVSEARAVIDIGKRCPEARVLHTKVGSCYRVRQGAVQWLADDEEQLVERSGKTLPHRYRPWAAPPLVDTSDTTPIDKEASTEQDTEAKRRREIEAWLQQQLTPALERAYPQFNTQRSLSFVVEVTYRSGPTGYCFSVCSTGCSMEIWNAAKCATTADEYDVLNAISATQLAKVISARAHWGEPLLGGHLRACHRAYDVNPNGMVRLPIGHIFLYYALSYAQSHERWVAHQLAGDAAKP